VPATEKVADVLAEFASLNETLPGPDTLVQVVDSEPDGRPSSAINALSVAFAGNVMV
jgi:hypothetical protein